ncbi:hypothetical protein SAY87_001408 [Trapa incisa]|uniref:Uncharacterized protein n=1 Tax=Trapa incisa TaxID=236973 RepID=A0AAN7JHD5_9MYRT|nr:hypothetical protein SAY87_001408 [Trapa incisa]
MASRALLRSWISRSLQRHAISSTAPPSARLLQGPRLLLLQRSFFHLPFPRNSRRFCSIPLNLDESQVPAAIDYRSMLQEDVFHKLADSTIHVLQEKLEDYGDHVDIDGFDVDYGNDVLTLKLGRSSKQTLIHVIGDEPVDDDVLPLPPRTDRLRKKPLSKRGSSDQSYSYSSRHADEYYLSLESELNGSFGKKHEMLLSYVFHAASLSLSIGLQSLQSMEIETTDSSNWLPDYGYVKEMDYNHRPTGSPTGRLLLQSLP